MRSQLQLDRGPAKPVVRPNLTDPTSFPPRYASYLQIWNSITSPTLLRKTIHLASRKLACRGEWFILLLGYFLFVIGFCEPVTSARCRAQNRPAPPTNSFDCPDAAGAGKSNNEVKAAGRTAGNTQQNLFFTLRPHERLSGHLKWSSGQPFYCLYVCNDSIRKKMLASVRTSEQVDLTLLASQKGRVQKRNSTLLTRRSSVWKLPMGGSDTEFDRLSRKHPAVLRSIPFGVPMVHF